MKYLYDVKRLLKQKNSNSKISARIVKNYEICRHFIFWVKMANTAWKHSRMTRVKKTILAYVW